MKHQLSIAFQTDKPISAYAGLAQQVEAAGFAAVSVYNDMLYQPAWLPLMEMARATSTIKVGVAAVNPFTCHPINIAGHIALIDEVSNGRAYLGIARGGWLDFLGLSPKRPLTAVREAFECVRHLLHQSPEPYSGRVFSTAGGDTLRWSILRPDVPLLLGTWGIKLLSQCAGLIDEIKIGGSANPAMAVNYRRLLDEQAVAHKRPVDAIGLVVGAVTVVDEDGHRARQLARREAALYLSIIADLDPTLEIEPDRLSKIKQASAAYDFDTVAGCISDQLLGRLAFAGTPDDIAQQAADLFEHGTNRVELGTPHGVDPESGLKLLGERVLPALKEYLI